MDDSSSARLPAIFDGPAKGIPSEEDCALVIGLCSHGLAICRSLYAAGVEVHALEVNEQTPGFVTCSATPHVVPSLKDESLVEHLLRFRELIEPHRRIVLIATNDDNVRLIAEHAAELGKEFHISWGNSAESIKALLLKNNIEARCNATGLNYPSSVTVNSLSEVKPAVEHMMPPFIAKPVTPQSGFKALKFSSAEALTVGLNSHASDFPVLIQEWIAGTDEDLFFSAVYLDEGRVLHQFAGKKIESYPPAMGQTTVAIDHHDEEVARLTRLFFDGLAMSGPASLEFKRDENERYWVIEPTVGRSDFWVGLCTGAGFDLPLMEFNHALCGDTLIVPSQTKPTLWIDSERDPYAVFRYLNNWRPFSSQHRHRVLSYCSSNDWRPFLRESVQTTKRSFLSVLRALKRMAVKDVTFDYLRVSSYQSEDELPKDAVELLRGYGRDYPFYTPEWFAILSSTVAEHDGRVVFFCLSDGDNTVAVLPMWIHSDSCHGLAVNKLTSLSNYYSPRFTIFHSLAPGVERALFSRFLDYFKDSLAGWDLLELFPLHFSLAKVLVSTRGPNFSYYISENFTQPMPESFEAYFGTLPSRLRNTINRKKRRLDRSGGWNVKVLSGGDGLDEALEHYQNVYVKSWKADEPYPTFIKSLVQLAARKNWLRLGTLRYNGTVVAAQIWLVCESTAYIYKLAYDPEYSEFSPGTILTVEMFRHVIDQDGIRVVDFLQGNDAFKQDWMSESASLYGVQWPNIRTSRGLIVTLINSIAFVKQTFVRRWR